LEKQKNSKRYTISCKKLAIFFQHKKTLGWVGTNSLLFGIAEISEKYVLAMPKI